VPIVSPDLPFGAEIRDLRAGDVDALLAFINPLIAEDTYIDMSGGPLSRADEAAFVTARCTAMARGDAVMRVAQLSDGRVAATGALDRQPGRRRHVAELGITVSAQHRDRGLGTAMVRDLCAQASRLGVRLVVLRVYATNERAQQVYRNCGFVEVGRIPGMVHHRGEDVDEVWMSRQV
jgi:RimJ/RimL family protein N-acetyltransferase